MVSGSAGWRDGSDGLAGRMEENGDIRFALSARITCTLAHIGDHLCSYHGMGCPCFIFF